MTKIGTQLMILRPTQVLVGYRSWQEVDEILAIGSLASSAAMMPAFDV
jgi:hypothetical protein